MIFNSAAAPLKCYKEPEDCLLQLVVQCYCLVLFGFVTQRKLDLIYSVIFAGLFSQISRITRVEKKVPTLRRHWTSVYRGLFS